MATAKRLHAEGFPVMPHFPARIIKDKAMLGDWIARYQGEADVKQGLILAGGAAEPAGRVPLLDAASGNRPLRQAGFERLHVAGHPEGNRDIDPDGSDAKVMEALRWKQAFTKRTDAKMAMATQFCFEAKPVIKWVDRLEAEGIDLPVHIGIAGPGQAADPDQVRHRLRCRPVAEGAAEARDGRDQAAAALRADRCRRGNWPPTRPPIPTFGIEQVHFFPLGGIKTNATWAIENGRRLRPARPRKA